MSKVFNLGSLLEAFNPGELLQHYYNKPLAGELDRATGYVASTRAANESTARKYEGDIDAALRSLRGLAPEDMATIGGLIQRGANYDPMNDYRTLRTENLGALKGVSDMLGNVGRRQQSLSLAGLGYGGGRGSSYQDVLGQSRVNTAIAPIAQSIFNSLGIDASSLNASRLNNLGSVLNAINQRAQVPTRGLDWRAAPVGLRNNILGNYLSGLGSVGETSRLNTAGFEQRDDPWVGALKAMDTSLNSALDTYLSMYGGGMMGGGGGGGASAPAPQGGRWFSGMGQPAPTVYSNPLAAYYGS